MTRLEDGTDPVGNVRQLVGRDHRVLVVSTVDDPAQIVAAVQAGAEDYVTKDNDIDGLLAAIHGVVNGAPPISRELVLGWLAESASSAVLLSPKEREVLRAYASGLTLLAAAHLANIQPGTAKGYLDRVKHKYRVAGRIANSKRDLAARAKEDGVIS